MGMLGESFEFLFVGLCEAIDRMDGSIFRILVVVAVFLRSLQSRTFCSSTSQQRDCATFGSQNATSLLLFFFFLLLVLQSLERAWKVLRDNGKWNMGSSENWDWDGNWDDLAEASGSMARHGNGMIWYGIYGLMASKCVGISDGVYLLGKV